MHTPGMLHGRQICAGLQGWAEPSCRPQPITQAIPGLTRPPASASPSCLPSTARLIFMDQLTTSWSRPKSHSGVIPSGRPRLS